MTRRIFSIPTENAELISRCLDDSPRRGVRKFARELRVCWLVSTEPSGRIIEEKIDTAVSEHLLTHVAHELGESLHYLRGKERETIEGVVWLLHGDLGLPSARPCVPILEVPCSGGF